MKFFLVLALLMLSSMSFASYTPLVEVTMSDDKTIHLVILNDSQMNLNSTYSVSWFVTLFSFRKEFGRVDLKAGEDVEFAYENNPYSRPTRINAKAICD